MRIGIIAQNKTDGRILKSLLSRNNIYYIFSKPKEHEGLVLDSVVETDNAWRNKHYIEILSQVEDCLVPCKE